MKAKRKTSIIEYTIWDGGPEMRYTPQWLRNAIVAVSSNLLAIQTNDGIVFASPRDYIVQDINGEIYPCTQNVFEKTFERVE